MTSFLAHGQAIRRAVGKAFQAEHGRRVALVAFVGKDALAYLPRPKGLELVCWPKAPGTNPTAVKLLQQNGVNVRFSDRLHMKVYWTATRGVVVASANLSANAYGTGSLHEAGVILPSSAVRIDRILEAIEAKDVTDAAMVKLRRDWARAAVLGGARPPAGGPTSFSDWMGTSKRRPWLLHCFDTYGGGPSQRLRSAAEEETGKRAVADQIYCRRGEVEPEAFVLSIDLSAKNRPLVDGWVFIHRVVLVARDDKYYNGGWPFQAGQLYRSAACPPPPFAIDAPFRRAIKASFTELGGTEEHFSIARTAAPSRRLVGLLEKHYRTFANV